MKQVISFALLSLLWYVGACVVQEGISNLIASPTPALNDSLPELGGQTRWSFQNQIGTKDQLSDGAASDAESEKEPISIAHDLVDAAARGDRAVWEKYVADDVIYTDENWKVLTKRELIDSIAPLPPGYSSSINMANIKSRIHGDAAVLSWEALEEEYVFGQRLAPVYLVTDTYFRRSGRWQLVAEQITVRPRPRKSITMNPVSYNAFVGEYQLTPGVSYVVTVDDGKLIGQRTGRDREELLPADENTFFRKDSIRGEKVFVHDANARVFAMLDRRENSDLIWKRIK